MGRQRYRTETTYTKNIFGERVRVTRRKREPGPLAKLLGAFIFVMLVVAIIP